MIEFQLQFISAIIILASSAVPIYLTIKLKDNLKKLTLILTVFILIHAVYHVFGFLGYSILAEGVFQPLSVITLIFFGIVYSGFTKPKSLGTKKHGYGVESWYLPSFYEQHYNNSAFDSLGYICMASISI